MIGRIRKIRDESGASIVMALFLLLIAVTVSTIMLMTALTAVRNVGRVRKQEESYQVVSKAAQYIGDEIQNTKIEKLTDSHTNPDSDLSDLLILAARTIIIDKEVYEHSFYLDIKDKESGEVEMVLVTFRMRTNGHISAECSLKEGEESNYILVVECPGEFVKVEPLGEEPTEYELLKATGYETAKYKITKKEG